jgi:hypothetical protein
MKEMVSWRGVAKKRRKQEAGGVVNQMFAYCCGHATIVAWRQPLYRAIKACRFTPAPDGFDFESPSSLRHNLSAIERETSPRICHAASRDELICRHASPRIAKRNSNHIPRQMIVRSPSARCAHRKLQRLTSIVFERDRVIFVRLALFARVFVTR